MQLLRLFHLQLMEKVVEDSASASVTIELPSTARIEDGQPSDGCLDCPAAAGLFPGLVRAITATRATIELTGLEATRKTE